MTRMDTHEARVRRLLALAAEVISLTPEELEAERQRRKGARMLAPVSSEEELPEQLPERPDVPEAFRY
jgi:hypothetical protein